MRKVLLTVLALAVTAGLTVATFAAEGLAGETCTAGDAVRAADLESAPEAPGAPGVPALQPEVQAAGQPCGGVTCGPKEYCCNPTCNACVPFGMSCTQEVCNSTFEAPEVEAAPTPCGNNFCGPGQFCCNPSCGICAPFGAACTDVYCPPEE